MIPVVTLVGLAIVASRIPIPFPASLVGWIEMSVNQRMVAYTDATLDFTGVSLGYDLEMGRFGLILEEMRVDGVGDGAQITLPRVRTSLDLSSMLRGALRVKRFQIEGAQLRLKRQPDGRILLGFGTIPEQAFELPASLPEAMALFDRVFEEPLFGALEKIELSDLAVSVEDLRHGKTFHVDYGHFHFEKPQDGRFFKSDITARFGRTGGAISASFKRETDGALTLQAQAQELSSSALTDLLAPDHVLASLGTTLTGQARAQFSSELDLVDATGQIELGPGRFPSMRDGFFDRVVANLHYRPREGRVEVSELSISSDQFRAVSHGQVFLPDGIASDVPLILQLQLDTLEIEPEDFQSQPFIFDTGLLEARMYAAPFSMEIGQAVITFGTESLATEGMLNLQDGQLSALFDLRSPSISVNTILALWPENLAPRARDWADRNLLSGRVRDLAASVKSSQVALGAVPEISASFEIEEATVRFLRHLPPAEKVNGAAILHDNRFVVRADAGTVPSGREAPIDISGTDLTIFDVRSRPARAEISLAMAGAIPDVLTLLDNRPFQVLSRSGRTADLASGFVKIQGRIETELRKGLKLPEVAFNLQGQLTNITSTVIVKNRNLSARALTIAVSNERGLEIEGEGRLDEIPLTFAWRQPIVARDQAPQPNQLSGRIRLNPDTLETFGVVLPPGSVRGSGAMRFAAEFQANEPTDMVLESNLIGLDLAIPQLGWRKPGDQTGQLTVRLPLTPGARQIDIDLAASGLEAAGAAQITENGQLTRLSLGTFTVGGWLQTQLELIPRGTETRIALQGGRAVLGAATFGSPQGGANSNTQTSIALNLDRLVVSENLVLRNFTGQFAQRGGGIRGQFEASLNGAAPIQGSVLPTQGGLEIVINGLDAGRILRAAGVFQNAEDGILTLTLRPTGQAKTYIGTLGIENVQLRNAPILAELLSAMSIVGLIQQLAGEGIVFSDVDVDFQLRPETIVIRQASAIGPSMAITAEGLYTLPDKRFDLQGVLSPLYLVNGLFGLFLSPRRNEGLIGIAYTLKGTTSNPQVQVNPLSVLTPGIFREIFRRPPPDINE